jgi:DDE superfamily endonuclease
MEDILELYTAQHSQEEPLICMDESSKQLLLDVVEPLPMEPGRVVREDHHYERNGVRSLFMFFDPLRGWRRVGMREHRTRVDWAQEIKTLLTVDYPHARKVKLVCDNLNTHHIASLYEAFPADEAREYVRRLEFHFTPRNGSWLNIAEIELSVLVGQCLDRRIGTDEVLISELAAWQDARNRSGARVVWRFSVGDARTRLAHLYPRPSN